MAKLHLYIKNDSLVAIMLAMIDHDVLSYL